MKKLISIVTPFYNEEKNIDAFYSRVKKLIGTENDYNFEIIAVEHGSTDSTFEKLYAIYKKDKKLKILQLSKNFGSADAGIAAGLNFAKGDAVIIIMADLQEPPEIITKFLRKWEEGYDVVYGIVKKRTGATLSRKIFSYFFYKLLNLMTKDAFPENVSDFRLLDKKVSTVINSMKEQNKFMRGLVSWTGFKQTGVPFDREMRHAGKSKADFLTVLHVAANGIFSFSYTPLKLVTIAGFLLSLISFLMIFYQIVLLIIFGRGAPGISTLVILDSFLFGMLFLILGIMGEYLSRIYDEVKGRPNFIVRRKIGL